MSKNEKTQKEVILITESNKADTEQKEVRRGSSDDVIEKKGWVRGREASVAISTICEKLERIDGLKKTEDSGAEKVRVGGEGLGCGCHGGSQPLQRFDFPIKRKW